MKVIFFFSFIALSNETSYIGLSNENREIVRLFQVYKLVHRGPTKIFCANFRIESFMGIAGTKNFVINADG